MNASMQQFLLNNDPVYRENYLAAQRQAERAHRAGTQQESDSSERAIDYLYHSAIRRASQSGMIKNGRPVFRNTPVIVSQNRRVA